MPTDANARRRAQSFWKKVKNYVDDRVSGSSQIMEIVDISEDGHYVVRMYGADETHTRQISKARSVNAGVGDRVIVSDVGGHLVATSALPTLDGSEDPDTAAINDLTSIKVGQRRRNLRSEGLSLDGVTDDTAGFAELLDGATPGDIFILDERARLKISSQVGWAGKRVELEGYGDATIISTSVLTEPLVYVLSAPYSSVRGVAIIGAETAFVGAENNQYALSFEKSDHVSVREVRTSRTSKGLRVRESDHVKVRDLEVEGMLPFVSSYAYVSENFHQACLFSDSHHGDIDGLTARNIGSAFLSGAGSSKGSLRGLHGFNCMDNGIYISSGEGWEIIAPHIVNDGFPVNAGYKGIKLRGARHNLLGGYIENVGTGIAMTDSGAADSGVGSTAMGVTVKHAKNVGAAIGMEYDDPPREMSILFCHFDDCQNSGSSGSGSVQVSSGIGHQVIGNTIVNQAMGSGAITAWGSAGDVMSALMVSHNKLRNINALGIRFGYVTGSVIAHNELEAILGTFGIYIDSPATKNDVYMNRPMGAGNVGSVAGIRAVSGSANNRVFENPRLSVQNMGAPNTNLFYANLDNNPVVSGSRGGNVALANLLNEMAKQGRITNSTT